MRRASSPPRWSLRLRSRLRRHDPGRGTRRDSFATVAGTVDRITDEDEFVLADATGPRPDLCRPDLVPVEPGETVTVTGIVDDGLRLEIYAREIVRADGTILTFDHRY
jgi:hypothetical protein